MVCTPKVDPEDFYAFAFEGTRNGAHILDSSIVVRQENVGWQLDEIFIGLLLGSQKSGAYIVLRHKLLTRPSWHTKL